MAAIYKVDESFDYALFEKASCAFGVFDGVHRGHRFIIEEAMASARKTGASVVVVTFDIDPDEVFAHGRLRKLMGNDQRLEALAALDVDAVVAFRFTREFASLDPAEFLDRTLGRHVPAHLHIGSDFRFGARALGTVEDLAVWGAFHGMEVHPYDLLTIDGAPVTSTRIRELLSRGMVGGARDLLGHFYSMRGEVVSGRGEGQDMGFRTANLQVAPELRALSDGVYAAYALIGGARYKAAVSVGVSPTFADVATANVEAHVLDFEGDLYGSVIELQFVSHLRPMMTFESTEELIKTVQGNINWVRENL